MSDAAAACAARAMLARRVLDLPDEAHTRVGAFTLRAEQRRTLAAVRAALEEFGGALLADPPGTGKTIVALAVAAVTTAPARGDDGARTLVVAPATLRAQWTAQAARAGVPIAFRSLESLSRGAARERPGLVIVDEAHHLREPSTRRHAHLAMLCEGAHVLLLTATPVVNRLADRDALLTLFLGARAASLDDAARGRCIVRRRAARGALPPVRRLPALRPSARVATHEDARETGPDDARAPTAAIAAALRTLSPPLPLADGTAATALVRMTLAMAWQSSLAALDAALRRRLQRGEALRDLLDAGRAPSRAALRHWTLYDDATQLALPLLVGDAAMPADDARRALDAHLDAVRSLRALVHPHVAADASARADALRELMRAHPAARLVVFARQAETVRALHRALRDEPGVVAIIGTRVLAASGRWSRDEVLRALGPRAGRPRERAARAIRLLLATDVLAEGVELQGADLVVHADLPWTPARLEQRLGRVRRQGRASHEVLETRFVAPRAARALVRLGARLARKDRLRAHAVHGAEARERIAAKLAEWRDAADHGAPAPARCLVAARHRFLAAVPIDGRWRLVGGWRAPGGWRVSTAPSRVWPLVRAAGADGTLDEGGRAVASRVLDRWLARRAAASLAGLGTPTARMTARGNAAADARLRRVRACLADLLSRAPTLHRRALAARHDQWLACLARPMPASRERHLDALLCAGLDPAEFARRLGALLGPPASRLSPSATPPAAPPPAPPSASPGSAAPR